MIGFLQGSATAMITPFTQTGVNFDAFSRMIEYQIQNGTDALVILGTTGEPATMTEEEKEAVIRHAVAQNGGRVKLIVGTGGNNTARVLEASRRAEELGADAILCVTPYYNKCTQAGLIGYYESIAQSVHIPVIAYNVPGRTGVNILPETMQRIAEFDNIAGIKEASGNMAQVMQTARLIRGRCDLYSGEDAINLPILTVGGSAVISALSNIVPAAVKQLCTAALAGDMATALPLNDRLLPLAGTCFLEVNPIPVKAAMNFLGFQAGEPRAPLTTIEKHHADALLKEMRAFGLEVQA